MSCEHFFCTWDYQKETRANLQDHSVGESIPDDDLKIGQKAPGHNGLQPKRLKNYYESLKFVPEIQDRAVAEQIYEGVKV